MIPYGREYTDEHGEPLETPIAAVDENTNPLLEGVRNGSWLDEQKFFPLRYAVPDLLPEGFSLLIGAPKAGKSWLALSILLSIASGACALGYISVGKARRVLYLALEDGHRRMQDRCRQLLGPGVAIPPLFHYLTTLTSGAVVPTIDAFLSLYPDTVLVFIDTLGKVMPPAAPGESAYQRDYRVGSKLKAIADARPGLALSVLHHDRKASSDDFVDSVSGTHGLAGSADTIIVLARPRHSNEGLLKVTGRDIQEAEYALTTTDGAWTLDGHSLDEAALRAEQRDETGRLGGTSNKVLEFVRSKGPQGVAAKDVTEKFGKDAHQYLKRLLDTDKIDRLKRGVYIAVRSVSLSEDQVAATSASDSSDSSDTT